MNDLPVVFSNTLVAKDTQLFNFDQVLFSLSILRYLNHSLTFCQQDDLYAYQQRLHYYLQKGIGDGTRPLLSPSTSP